MRVLIINTSEHTGGAAVAAHRLCEALIDNGVIAKMLVMHKQTDALHVVTAGNPLFNQWHFLWERLVIWIHNHFHKKNLFKISIANVGQDITKTTEFQEADIIHLHWINQGFLSLHSIKKIFQSGKPVVWTMHDMWEATAICHHAYSCENYKQECGKCPFLHSPKENDLSHQVFVKKRDVLSLAHSKVQFVAVSNWLAERSRSSSLIGNLPITVIPNTIPISQFVCIDRNDARTTLNVSEPYVIAFGAARIDDTIKGFSYLIEALQHLLAKNSIASDKIRLLLFGDIRDQQLLQQVPVAYTHLGYVGEEDQLSLIYSSANVTVSSSLYETFGQTLIEAQACGSIPVSFEGSGQNDIIEHMKTGYLAKRFSAESLAKGIEWGFNATIPSQFLRRSVIRRYGESAIANQYIRLYNTLCPIKA